MIRLQKLSDDDVANINDLNSMKHNIYDIMMRIDDKQQLQHYAADIKNIDFQIQKTMKLPVDENFHRWYEVPKCDCPKDKNADLYGTSHRHYSKTCIIHGK